LTFFPRGFLSLRVSDHRPMSKVFQRRPPRTQLATQTCRAARNRCSFAVILLSSLDFDSSRLFRSSCCPRELTSTLLTDSLSGQSSVSPKLPLRACARGATRLSPSPPLLPSRQVPASHCDLLGRSVMHRCIRASRALRFVSSSNSSSSQVLQVPFPVPLGQLRVCCMVGLFQENGPCRINNDSTGVHHNLASWNNVANVYVYIHSQLHLSLVE
jgi:hypothetical protein